MGCEKVLRGQCLPCRKSKDRDIHILVLLQDIAQDRLSNDAFDQSSAIEVGPVAAASSAAITAST
jgi:hypothetical protein